MPRLGRAVRGDDVVSHAGSDRRSDQRGRAGDQAVHHRRDPRRGRAEVDAGQHADLVAPKRREQRDAVLRVGTVRGERCLDGGDLRAQGGSLDAAAAPGDGLGGPPGRRGDQRGRRGAVADAHLAAADDVEPRPLPLLLDQRDPGGDRALRDLAAHRRALRDVAAAARQIEAYERRVAGLVQPGRPASGGVQHPGVDDSYSRPGVVGEHVDRRAAREEVRDHLRRHLGRIGGNAAGRDTVIGSRHHDEPLLQPRTRTTTHARDAHGELLKASEGARRLRQLVLASARAGGGFSVGGRNRRSGGVDGSGRGVGSRRHRRSSEDTGGASAVGRSMPRGPHERLREGPDGLHLCEIARFSSDLAVFDCEKLDK